ncbi:hypothetical protein PoHVEF18_008930 [Penicillium ochrochloron]
MAPLSGDGVLWLCLGFTLVFAVRGIIEDLRHVVGLTEIKHLEKEDKIISEGTEDVNKNTACSYLQDLETFTALITCLCNFLDEHTEPWSATISPILPKTRPLGESKAIEILWILLPGNVSTALEAGIVSRWLTNYPFPCAVDKDRKDDVVLLVKAWWSDDETMSNIFEVLTSHREGNKQLRKYGLNGPIPEDEGDNEDEPGHDDDQHEEHEHGHGYDDEHTDGQDDVDYGDHDEHEHEHEHGYEDELDDDQDDVDDDEYDMVNDHDIRMVGGEDTAGPDFYVSSRFQFSARDQALRRRRREAMVLSEGGHPLGHEDIIQRPIQDD